MAAALGAKGAEEPSARIAAARGGASVEASGELRLVVFVRPAHGRRHSYHTIPQN